MAKQYKVVEAHSAGKLEDKLNVLEGNWTIETVNVRDTGSVYMALLSSPKPITVASVKVL